MRFAVIIALSLGLSMAAAFAVEPDEVLADPQLETRARAISQELRCLVCQNETIDESNAKLAKDLRMIVRERLVAGDTDQEVIQFVVARYGDFVLLRPPVRPGTWVLWFGPLVLLLIGIVGVGALYRRSRTRSETASEPLTVDEEQQVKSIIETRS